MNRRLLVVAAASVGTVAVVVAARLIADRYAAAGARSMSLATARAEVAGFVGDVRDGMHQRHNELRVAIGLDTAAPEGGLDASATRELLDDPVGWRAPRG